MNIRVTDSQKKLRWIEMVAKLLDNQFRLPGTDFRFGLDPILNLIPFAGNIPGTIVSAGLLLTMAKHGASRKVIILMTLNVLLDAVFGSIPVIGQLFDFVYKANAKNIRLLKEHYQEGKHQGSGSGAIIIIAVVLVAVVIFIAWAVWSLSKYLYQAIF